jgi:multiple sugar transport system substrate-binding protein
MHASHSETKSCRWNPESSIRNSPKGSTAMGYGKRLFVAAALASAAALSTLVVVAAAAQNENVTITYATPAGGGQPEIKLYDALIKQFEALHPNITIKQDIIPATSDPQFWQKLQVQAAANQYPDLTYVHYSWFPQAVRFNYLSPLDSGSTNASINKNSFFSTTIQQFTYQGHLYGLPRETSTIALYYNATMFARAHLKTPNQYYAAGKWTWNTYKEVAKKLTNAKAHQWGAIAPVDVPYGLFSTIYSFGGSILNADNTKSSFDTAPNIAAMSFLRSIIANKSAVLPAQNAKLNLFANGKVGMYISGYWDVALTGGSIKTFKWDVAPLPHGKTNLTRVASGGYGIPAKAAHPQEALEFLRFLETRQSTQYLAKLGLIIPALKGVAESSTFLQPHGVPAHRSVFIAALKHGKLDPEIPQWAQMVDAITSGTDPIWTGAQTPQQAGRSVAQQVDSVLKSG